MYKEAKQLQWFSVMGQNPGCVHPVHSTLKSITLFLEAQMKQALKKNPDISSAENFKWNKKKLAPFNNSNNSNNNNNNNTGNNKMYIVPFKLKDSLQGGQEHINRKNLIKKNTRRRADKQG